MTGGSNKRVSLAALIAVRPGCWPRLIYPVCTTAATHAHELNPVESVWSQLKRSPASPANRDISQLTALVKTRLRRMQYRPGLLDGCLAGTRLDLTPFCNLRNGGR